MRDKEEARMELETVQEAVRGLLNEVQDVLDASDREKSFAQGMAAAYHIVSGIVDVKIQSILVERSEDEKKLTIEIVGRS